MMTSLLLLTALLTAAAPPDRPTIIVVVGAPGAEEFRQPFNTWADRWRDAAQRADANYIEIGRESGDEPTDFDRVRRQLLEKTYPADQPLWLVLIGHGTFDGRTARFNLRGPDVSAAQLAQWLKPINAPIAVIDCASASGPFINALSAPNRVIVTATNSGFEYNFARFGDAMSKAITDPDADLDKDQQTSLLEAFLAASSRTQEFYEQQRRLATEHALIDDNGDGLGTPFDWFRGVRATKTAKDGALPDGLRANQIFLIKAKAEQTLTADQRARRDELELQLAKLRQAKPNLPENYYYEKLEPIMLELARLYEETDKQPTPAP